MTNPLEIGICGPKVVKLYRVLKIHHCSSFLPLRWYCKCCPFGWRAGGMVVINAVLAMNLIEF
jgi:hypothetical protein